MVDEEQAKGKQVLKASPWHCATSHAAVQHSGSLPRNPQKHNTRWKFTVYEPDPALKSQKSLKVTAFGCIYRGLLIFSSSVCTWSTDHAAANLLTGVSNSQSKAGKAMCYQIFMQFKSLFCFWPTAPPPQQKVMRQLLPPPATKATVPSHQLHTPPKYPAACMWTHDCISMQWTQTHATVLTPHTNIVPSTQPAWSMAAAGETQSTTELTLSETAEQIWANTRSLGQFGASCHVLVAFMMHYYVLWNWIYCFKPQFDILA